MKTVNTRKPAKSFKLKLKDSAFLVVFSLNTRNGELSIVQKLVSTVLGLGGCSKVVVEISNFKLR